MNLSCLNSVGQGLSPKRSLAAWLAAAVALVPALSFGQVPGMTVDQNGEGVSAGYYAVTSGWQSFTAGTNGHLGAVDLQLYSPGVASWTATLSIYEGQGTGGTRLLSQTISGNDIYQWNTYILEGPVPQTNGGVYTVVIANPTTALRVRVTNSYPGGQCSINGAYDFRFHTYVITSDWSEEAYRDTSFTTGTTVISTAAQLAQFAYLVNSGAYGGGTFPTITLANDISLAGHFWTPICTDGTFPGTFEGNNKTIRCVIIDRPTSDKQGLFGFMGGTIRNVNVADADITGHDYVGGLVGDGFGVVSNCSVSGTVAGRFYVGGILGYGHGTIEACTNRSSVTGYSHVGGVVGLGGNDPLVGCRNEGGVSGSSINAGGVMGSAQGDIVDCSNAGAVICPGVFGCGGIVGNTDHKVRNCQNSGSVSGLAQVGGIIGQGCEELMRCGNTGGVTGNTDVGGIAGALNQGFMIDCANHGAVVASGTAGGLAGKHEGSVFNSANAGSVSGGEGVGGLTGISETSGQCRNCQNRGAVGGTSSVGALAGRGGILTNCYWKQTGAAPFNLAAGGDGSVTLQDCRDFGAAPGTLSAPVTLASSTTYPVTTTSLSGALNAYVVANASLHMGLLRRWTSGSGTAYPLHADTRWSDPGNYDTSWFNPVVTHFTIGTAEELAGLAVLVNGGQQFKNQTVTLTADITLTDREWTPIGFRFSPERNWFHGTLEGNGKTIIGAWQDAYDMTRYEFAGLFGVLDALATVRNLMLVDSQSVGGGVAGGIAGYQLGTLRNCSSNASAFSREYGGCLVGFNGEDASIENCHASGFSFCDGAAGALAAVNMGTISTCYWRHTGEDPLNQPAIGAGNSIGSGGSFSDAPGTLTAPVTVGGMTTSNLSAALNVWVDTNGGAGAGLYNWTAGTTARYPRLSPVITVGGTPVPQTLTEGFAVETSLTESAGAVAAYTNAHPGTTAASFGEVLRMAEAMGFKFAELADGQAILDFHPTVLAKGFAMNPLTLTFAVENGIDPTPTAAMNRLAGSPTAFLQVQQIELPGGAATPLATQIQFHGDGTASATFNLPNPPPSAFFRLALDHQP